VLLRGWFLLFLNLDDLPSVISTAGRAGAMGHFHRMALGTFDQRRRYNRDMAQPLVVA
jgi:hypothetical protein